MIKQERGSPMMYVYVHTKNLKRKNGDVAQTNARNARAKASSGTCDGHNGRKDLERKPKNR